MCFPVKRAYQDCSIEEMMKDSIDFSSEDDFVSTVAEERLQLLRDLELEDYEVKRSLLRKRVTINLSSLVFFKGAPKQSFHDQLPNHKTLMKVILANLIKTRSQYPPDTLFYFPGEPWPNPSGKWYKNEHLLLCYLADLTVRLQQLEVDISYELLSGEPLTFNELKLIVALFGKESGFAAHYLKVANSNGELKDYYLAFSQEWDNHLIKDSEKIKLRERQLAYYIGIAERQRLDPNFYKVSFLEDGWLRERNTILSFFKIKEYFQKEHITEEFLCSNEFRKDTLDDILKELPEFHRKFIWDQLILWLKFRLKGECIKEANGIESQLQHYMDILKNKGVEPLDLVKKYEITWDPALVEFLESNGANPLQTQMILDHLKDQNLDTLKQCKEQNLDKIFDSVDIPRALIFKLKEALNDDK